MENKKDELAPYAKPVLVGQPAKREEAGAPGFEPRFTDSKSGVLPLHHAPERRKLYHNLFLLLVWGQPHLASLFV